jgi:hypothetical protein
LPSPSNFQSWVSTPPSVTIAAEFLTELGKEKTFAKTAKTLQNKNSPPPFFIQTIMFVADGATKTQAPSRFLVTGIRKSNLGLLRFPKLISFSYFLVSP